MLITESSHIKYLTEEPTKKNSWVDKDLSESPKKKCFEQNTEPWTAEKNRTTKNWMEEDLKFPKERRPQGDSENVMSL